MHIKNNLKKNAKMIIHLKFGISIIELYFRSIELVNFKFIQFKSFIQFCFKKNVIKKILFSNKKIKLFINFIDFLCGDYFSTS